jgi:hypothetical protein
MLYVPPPVVIVSASGAGAMDLARIGMILVDIGSSKTAAPGRADLIEVGEDNPPDLAAQSRRAVVFELLFNVEAIGVDPVLAVGIALYSMNVHRLVSLVRIEEESPPPAPSG